MRKEEVYIADDGTRFEGIMAYSQCLRYERDKAWETCGELRNYIRFYDWNGTELNAKSASQNRYSIYFAKVLAIPNEEKNEEALKMWNNTVSCDLDDAICRNDLGWYCSDGDDNWHYWDDMVKKYEECKAMIEKIEQGQ